MTALQPSAFVRRLLLCCLLLPRPSTGRCCVRVTSQGREPIEVCSGWLAFEERCADVMAPFGGVQGDGAEIPLPGALSVHRASCYEASDMPGVAWNMLLRLSVLGWLYRAWTLLPGGAHGDELGALLFPSVFAVACLCVIWGRASSRRMLTALGVLPLLLTCFGGGRQCLRRALLLCASRGGVDTAATTALDLKRQLRASGLRAVLLRAIFDRCWLLRVVMLVAVASGLLGVVWDRSCNTDFGSVDHCALWRVGTLESAYNGAFGALLSTGAAAPVAEFRRAAEGEMCLPPEVRRRFEGARPRRAAGERYSLARFRPWSFGTDASATAALEASALAWGVPLKVEGKGRRWAGLQTKLIAFHDFVANEAAPGDVVMMMDANDVEFVGGARSVLDAYQDLGAPIVVSAERGCAPAGSGLEARVLCNRGVYPSGSGAGAEDFRFLNSGTYIGDRDAVLHVLDFVASEWGFRCHNALGQAFGATRDQRCLTSFYVHCSGRGDVVLDHGQRVVSTLAMVPLARLVPDVERGHGLLNLEAAGRGGSGRRTAMLHGNGWQAHLTLREFAAKFARVRAPPNASAARGGEETAVRYVVRDAYRGGDWVCWDPHNSLPCHGFDLFGAANAALTVMALAAAVLAGRVVFVLAAWALLRRRALIPR